MPLPLIYQSTSVPQLPWLARFSNHIVTANWLYTNFNYIKFSASLAMLVLGWNKRVHVNTPPLRGTTRVPLLALARIPSEAEAVLYTKWLLR